MISRRAMVAGGALALAGGGALVRAARAAGKSFLPPGLPKGVYDTATLEALPGKKPLVKLTYRPPNYETPLSHFTSEFTPNESFFVCYHLAGIPPQIDAARWKLKVGGDGVGKPLELSLAALRSDFEAAEIAAVCQCSGNRRGFSEPHVAGVQWGLGAVGNAVWKGVRLKDVLNRANLRRETIEIVVNGADHPVLDGTPDFVKSIPVDKALNDNTLIAYGMNGAPLPHYNGYPLRLIVPGWTATYWMKHLDTIEASTKPFTGYWMKSAYRIPTGKFSFAEHFASQMTAANEPITEMVVNSMITAPEDGHVTGAKAAVDIRGLAWDGGSGIGRVEISTDGGEAWREARLEKDFGRFAFRVLSLFLCAAARRDISANGARHQRAGSDPSRQADLQSRGLPQQCGPPAYDKRGLGADVFASLVALSFATAALGAESVALKAGAGRDVVERYCSLCHSLDYPRINAPFLNRQGWETEVDKMIKAYGAPIGPDDAQIIVDYLAANYGNGG